MSDCYASNQYYASSRTLVNINGHREPGQLFAEDSYLIAVAKRTVIQSPLEAWLLEPPKFNLLLVLIDNFDFLLDEEKTNAGFINLQAIDVAFYGAFFKQKINHESLLITQQSLMLKSRVLGFAAQNKDEFLRTFFNAQLQPYHFHHKRIKEMRKLATCQRNAVEKRLNGPIQFLW